jgi:hypothetical protein
VDRYKLIILLFLFIATPSHAGMMMMTGDGTSAAACTDANPVGKCTGFLICQNFETTAESCTTCNEDNSESWVKTIGGDGTITVDYGTPLRGAQSLQVAADGSVASSIAITISGQDTVYGFFRFKTADGRPASTNEVLSLSDGSSIVGGVRQVATGKLRMYNGTAYSESATTLDDGASGTVYVWFYWTKGTGTDGTMGIEVNTTRAFSAWEDEDTTGTATTQPTIVQGKDRYTTSVVLDQVLIKTTAIGTVCE